MRRSAPSSHCYGYLAWTHTHTHTLYILAGPGTTCVCMCAIVHVSEVGQQQRYLTHPEKTSGEQSSHWLQLTHTHKGYQSYTWSHLCCTCTGAHKNIWLNLWTHTKTKSQWTWHRGAKTGGVQDTVVMGEFSIHQSVCVIKIHFLYNSTAEHVHGHYN